MVVDVIPVQVEPVMDLKRMMFPVQLVLDNGK
jgi:hypothetical protein